MLRVVLKPPETLEGLLNGHIGAGIEKGVLLLEVAGQALEVGLAFLEAPLVAGYDFRPVLTLVVSDLVTFVASLFNRAEFLRSWWRWSRTGLFLKILDILLIGFEC